MNTLRNGFPVAAALALGLAAVIETACAALPVLHAHDVSFQITADAGAVVCTTVDLSPLVDAGIVRIP